MDSLSQVCAFDPWAVRGAKALAMHAEEAGTLMPVQSDILRILKESGGIESTALLRWCLGKLTAKDLEREFSPLRHMEKARGEKREDHVAGRLRWGAGTA